MVFFEDKNSSFSIDRPEDFLSSKAIDRRLNQSISITEQDLPVNQDYISSMETLGGLTVWYTTKWLNGALIETDSAKLAELSALSFVRSMELAAPGPLRTTNLNQGGKMDQKPVSGRSQSTEIQNRMLGVDQMHQEGVTGSGMLIAVFDGGFMGVDQLSAFSHIAPGAQLNAAFDFVGNSDNVFRYGDHGTKVLSVIGANEPGVFTGSAYDADFILCVTEDVSSEYRIEEYNWLFAAEMADSSGVDIINTSLGYHNFDNPTMNYQLADLDGNTAVISMAANIAASKGILLTISAGNQGNSAWNTLTTPADIQDAISVGAINDDSIKASFSSTGPTADNRIKPDVVALGVNTAVINSGGNVVFNNGTSFSAPQVAGLAAGIWQSNPEFTYLEVIQALREAGHSFSGADSQTGYGIPNYQRAKRLVLSVEDPETPSLIRLYPNPVGDQLYLLSQQDLDQALFFVHNIQGQAIMEQSLWNIRANSEVIIALPEIAAGVYLITVLAEEGAETFRVIRE